MSGELYKGSTSISEVYCGSDSITSIYKGDSLIWEKDTILKIESIDYKGFQIPVVESIDKPDLSVFTRGDFGDGGLKLTLKTVYFTSATYDPSNIVYFTCEYSSLLQLYEDPHYMIEALAHYTGSETLSSDNIPEFNSDNYEVIGWRNLPDGKDGIYATFSPTYGSSIDSGTIYFLSNICYSQADGSLIAYGTNTGYSVVSFRRGIDINYDPDLFIADQV